jgi:hypothetical protein
MCLVALPCVVTIRDGKGWVMNDDYTSRPATIKIPVPR